MRENAIKLKRKKENNVSGKWRDVTCESPNYVVCEKLQRWSLEKLQKTLLDSRRDQIGTKIRLTESESKIEYSSRNPVPIGFIYVQLPTQPEPKSLWPKVEWKDVSVEYAGQFFRAEGGGSAQFGTVQGENAPRVTEARMRGMSPNPGNGPFWDKTVFRAGDWSSEPGIYTGSWHGGDHTTVRFLQTGGEIRPRNTAIRIWKRVQ